MRVLVISTNYAPERTAVAPFNTGLCEHLASQGHEVIVVTGFPYYPEWRVWDGYRGRLYSKDCVNNIPLRRVWHFVPSRPSSLIQRLAHDLSFTLSAFVAGLFAGKCDLIYCVCPPPTLAFTAYVLAKIKRAPYVIKLTDLASDAALATGILKDGLVIQLARVFERFVYRRAEAIICLCQGFVDKLTAHDITPERLHLIPDWGDTQNIRPIEGESSFRKKNGLPTNQLLVMYSGNMGKKQGLTNIVQAAELSRNEPEIMWLLVGEGEERALLQREILDRNLGSINLLPLQPAESLPQMYSAADVLLLNQRASVEDSVIPSKLLTYMAAGRAVLAAVSEKSEAARQIRRAECGLVVPAEDPAAVVEALLSLRRDPALRAELGANGRAYAEKHFTKQKVLQKYDEFFGRFTGKEEVEVFVSKKVAAN
jgi:colanic acid biosynthesis glycosyl transferase WcaI